MRIAFIIPALVNRGPIIVVKDIINEIVNEVDEVVVFYLDDKTPEIEFPCKVTKVSFLNFKSKLKGFDILHSHMLRPDIMLSLLKDKNVLKLSTLHNYMYADLSNTHGRNIAYITQKIWLKALNRFNKVICLTSNMKAYYIKLGLTKPELGVVYNGRPKLNRDELKDVDNGDHAVLQRYYKQYFTIGVSALLTPRKGIEQIVNILHLIDDVGLIIIGDGPEKDNLVTIAKKNNVVDRCLFLGYKNNASRYFKFFKSFAMPSRSEGFPLAMIEASSFKLPLLVSDLPLFREILSEKEAIFVDLDNSESMKAGINNLKANASQLSERAFEAYLTKFDSAIMGKNYLLIYSQLVKEKEAS